MIGCNGMSKQLFISAMTSVLDSKDSRLLLRAAKVILAVNYEFVYIIEQQSSIDCL